MNNQIGDKKNNLFKAKRIKQGCCGMVKDQVYNARWEYINTYIEIQLENGEWTSGHYFLGFFEVINE